MTARVPIRMCVSCRRKAPQASLIRVAVDNDGAVAVAQLRRSGRGAYVCPRRECLAGAVKKGALQRGLRTRIDIPAPEQIASSAVTVVASRLQRITRCPSASAQRGRLTRLLDTLQGPTRSASDSQ